MMTKSPVQTFDDRTVSLALGEQDTRNYRQVQAQLEELRTQLRDIENAQAVARNAQRRVPASDVAQAAKLENDFDGLTDDFKRVKAEIDLLEGNPAPSIGPVEDPVESVVDAVEQAKAIDAEKDAAWADPQPIAKPKTTWVEKT